MTDPRTCALCAKPIGPRRKKYCSTECFVEHRHQKKLVYDRLRYQERSDEIKARVSAWYGDNLDRKREYDRDYRARTADRRNEVSREYRARRLLTDPLADVRRAQRRRARVAANGIFEVTQRDLDRMLRRYRNACAYCSVPFASMKAVEWDHVIPICRGGRHSIGNLLPACRGCNRSKMRRLIVEWRAGRVVPYLTMAGH